MIKESEGEEGEGGPVVMPNPLKTDTCGSNVAVPALSASMVVVSMFHFLT